MQFFLHNITQRININHLLTHHLYTKQTLQFMFTFCLFDNSTNAGANFQKRRAANTPAHIRPLTNKDYTNNTLYKHGLARPLKLYRSGRISNRLVTSSIRDQATLAHVNDQPGRLVTSNDLCTNEELPDVVPYSNVTVGDLFTANGSNYPRNARKRVLSASTLLSPRYYTTHASYMYNRCQTFDQRQYNFVSTPLPDGEVAHYVGQCAHQHPNKCSRVYYNPNNLSFATQGAVQSSLKVAQEKARAISFGAFDDDPVGSKIRSQEQWHRNFDSNCKQCIAFD